MSVGAIFMANGGFRFCYSVFSTYTYDTYQFGYQPAVAGSAMSKMAQQAP